MFRCLSINDLIKCKSALDRGKSNRKKQHGERGMTASLLKILFTENTHLTLTKNITAIFRYENITIINKPIDQQFYLHLIRE